MLPKGCVTFSRLRALCISRTERESVTVKEISSLLEKQGRVCSMSVLTENQELRFWRKYARFPLGVWKTQSAGFKRDFRNSKLWLLTMIFCSSTTKSWRENSISKSTSATATHRGKNRLLKTETKLFASTFLKAPTFRDTAENTSKNWKTNCKDASWNV